MIEKGLVVACTENSRAFYEDLVKTLKVPYPVLFSWEEIDRPAQSHEYAAVRVGATWFKEFIFLHDSVMIKNNLLFDELFAIPGHVSLSEKFFHLMGKYVSDDLPAIPNVTTKEQSIANELTWFTKPFQVFKNPLPFVSSQFEDRHGRRNMVLENDYLIKYKGHWA